VHICRRNFREMAPTHPHRFTARAQNVAKKSQPPPTVSDVLLLRTSRVVATLFPSPRDASMDKD